MPVLVLKQKCKSLLMDDGRWMPSDGSPGLSSLSILFQFYHGSQFYWFKKLGDNHNSVENLIK